MLKLIVASAAMMTTAFSTTTQAGIAENAARTKVAGVDLITYPMGVKDVVTVAGALPAGNYFATLNSGNPTIATLTGLLLDKGTAKQDRFALAKELDDVGAQLNFRVGIQQLSIEGKALTKDIPRVIRILGEELREPAFSQEEFEKAKQQLAGELREQLGDVDQQALQHFMRAVFPAGHPNRPASCEEQLAALDHATLDQVRSFYKQYYGPAHFTLIFTGDVDTKAIRSAVSKAFSGWEGGVAFVRTAPAATLAAAGGTQDVNMPDKASVSVLAGEATGLRYADSDAVALRVGTAVLGSGFTGRLMSTVRVKEGLTYGIGASLGSDEFVDGRLLIRATFAPSLLNKGVASTRRELQKWRQQGITAQELALRKTNLVGSFETSLATTEGMAASIQFAVYRNEPLSWLDAYPQAIDALTLEQVNGAIAKHINLDHMTWIQTGTLSAQPPREK